MVIQYDAGEDRIIIEGFGIIRRGIPAEVPDRIAESLLRKERLGFKKVEEKPAKRAGKKEE